MKILICGAGAIGSNLTKFLVPDLKGTHEITVLDMDNVEERNIIAGTQFYTEDQIGLSKVEALQYNIYKWYSREIDIIDKEFGGMKLDSYTPKRAEIFDLIIDCFDNHDARYDVQQVWTAVHKPMLHIGFSDAFTFAIEWADNYTVPSDITSGMDICEMQGASAFIGKVAAFGAFVVEEFISNGKKLEMLGGRYNQSIVK